MSSAGPRCSTSELSRWLECPAVLGLAPTSPTEAAVSPPEPATLPGLAAGNYTLVRRLGAGGMGEVWLARRHDGAFELDVAVKVLHGVRHAPEAERRFRLERRLLARLDHPSIARILDAGTLPDGRPYFAMERIDGEPIDLYCARHRVPLKGRLELVLQLLDALIHAHDAGIVHRDVKPHNVLVEPTTEGRGRVKLIDFGIAKCADTALVDAQTRTGLRPLTLRYASPEQVSGDTVGLATDLHAAGLILFELCSGRRARRLRGLERRVAERIVATGAPRKASAALEEPPTPRTEPGDPDLDLRPPDEPEWLAAALRCCLDGLISKALRRRPAERHRDARELRQDLSEAIEVLESPPALARRKRRHRRRAARRLALASCLLILLQGGSDELTGDDAPTPAAEAAGERQAGGAGNSDASATAQGSAAGLLIASIEAPPELRTAADHLRFAISHHLRRSAPHRLAGPVTTRLLDRMGAERLSSRAWEAGGFETLRGRLRRTGADTGELELFVERDGEVLRAVTLPLVATERWITHATMGALAWLGAAVDAGELTPFEDPDRLAAAAEIDRLAPQVEGTRDLAALYRRLETLRGRHPELTQAWALSASVLVHRVWRRELDGGDVAAEIEAQLAEALRLDAESLEAALASALWNFFGLRDWPAAGRALRSTPDLASHPHLVPPAALYLAATGDLQAALELSARGLATDPLDVDLAQIHSTLLYASGQPDEALHSLDRLSNPWAGDGNDQGHYFRAQLLLAQGRLTEAELVAAGETNSVLRRQAQSLTAFAAGDEQRAREHLRSLEAHEESGSLAFFIAEIHASIGHGGEAVRWLRLALRRGDPNLTQVDVSPHFQPIRSDPVFLRFRRDLHRRVGLSPGAVEDGGERPEAAWEDPQGGQPEPTLRRPVPIDRAPHLARNSTPSCPLPSSTSTDC